MSTYLALTALSAFAAYHTPLHVGLPAHLDRVGLFAVYWGVAVALYWLIWRLDDARQTKKRGCEEPPVRYAKKPFGIDLIQRIIDADKRNEVPEEFPRIFKEMGVPTWKQTTLATPVILTVDPKNVQAMLATQFHDFELGKLRSDVFFPLLGHGIFTVDGKYWEHSRALLRPQFTRDQVADLELEETHVQDMLQHLPSDAAGWTSETNLAPLFFRLTLDSATEFLFGHSVHSQIAALPDHAVAKQNFEKRGNLEWDKMAGCFDGALNHCGKRSRLRSLYWTHNPKEFRDDCEEVHRFADYYVKQALNTDVSQLNNSDIEKGRGKYIFLHELVKSTRDPTEVRSQLLNILLAGRDTTAGLLGWTFWLLARHPDVFSKLRSSIVSDFGTFTDPRNITFATLKSCTYLQHVMNEVLRLFPAVPVNGRRATRDTTLPRGGGPDGQSPIFIRKGTDVGYSVITMQRRKDIWGEDAEEFRPERWQGRRPGWEYLPFNGGPRICLGQQFALTEAGYVIVRLLQRFNAIKTSDGSSVRKHQFGVTSSPLTCLMSLHEATS